MDIDIENPAFTGFFNEGHKRIDIVIVINDSASNEMQEIRLNFFMNAIKFGLELEVEEGKLAEHKNLIFIKVHAPDVIIEEFGLFFNERKFFKEIHNEYLHPFFNFIGIVHEREIIKTIRNQYPGPGNYSTLERSMIVYKILQELPFGKHENHYGITKLISSNIIFDAFALHDGPYFIAPRQEATEYINARQALFYNWVGVINIWKMQPVHMIREYLGERIAFYFAYYEFFNIMLAIISVVGAWIAYDQYFVNIRDVSDTFDDLIVYICKRRHRIPKEKYKIEPYLYPRTCNECRHLNMCPFVPHKNYCRELFFIWRVDNESSQFFAFLVSVTGIIFVTIWKRKESYLMWIWEINAKLIEKIRRPEVLPFSRISEKSIIFIILRGLIIFFTMATFGVLLYYLLVISIKFCYFKNWYRHWTVPRGYSYYNIWKKDEHKFIAMAAVMHTTIVFLFKIVGMVSSYILTEFENYKTYAPYDRSLGIKMFGFSFPATFMLLFCYMLLGELLYTHPLDMNNWYTLEGFGLLNNGLGTSFDDICVTVAVLVVLDQVIFKIPTILFYKVSDYDQLCIIDNDIPCWEREYRLPNLTEMFIHNSYYAIAMQFAMATFLTYTCSIVPLFIFLVNIWDIRYKARKVLLWHRRPLLMNASGPGIWHLLVFVTAHVMPLFNVFVLAFQSRFVRDKYIFDLNIRMLGPFWISYEKEIPVPMFYPRYKKMEVSFSKLSLWYNHLRINWTWCGVYSPWYREWTPYTTPFRYSLLYYKNMSFGFQLLLVCQVLTLLLSAILHYLFPSKTDDLKATIRKEKQIKQKFYIRKGFLERWNRVTSVFGHTPHGNREAIVSETWRVPAYLHETLVTTCFYYVVK